MLKIKSFNEIYYYIDTDYEINNKLKHYFSIRSPGFFFNPKYKSGIWNGFIQLYNDDNLLYKGLLNDLKEYCKNNNIEIVYDNNINNEISILDEDSLNEFIKNLNLSVLNKKTNTRENINPYDYQLEAIKLCLSNKKQIIESITSSGKSLIIYILTRYLEKILIQKNNKILIIVPSIILVKQMYDDFKDYSFNDENWDVEKSCYRIFSTSKDKNEDAKIYITTWQSLKNKKRDYFKQFTVVIDDEVHGAKATVLHQRLSLCINSKYRFGFTGTFVKELLYRKQIIGLFVNHNIVSTYDSCLNDDTVTPIDITCLILNYDVNGGTHKPKYIDEMKYIQGSQYRYEILKKLVNKLEGNTLLLFRDIKNHAEPLFNYFLSDDVLKNNKKSYIMDKDTEDNIREEIKLSIDTKNNVLLFATYKLLSTGWSVKNLNNIIFADPVKSEITVVQSIGRGLRKFQNKENCKLYDIVDKFNYKNILHKHYEERIKIYKDKKYNYKIIELK